MLMPVFGPLADHHYFERLSFHSHLFLSEDSLDHVHVHETGGTGLDGEDQEFVAFAVDGGLVPAGVPHIDVSTSRDELLKTVIIFVRREEVSKHRYEAPRSTVDEPPRMSTQFPTPTSRALPVLA